MEATESEPEVTPIVAFPLAAIASIDPPAELRVAPAPIATGLPAPTVNLPPTFMTELEPSVSVVKSSKVVRPVTVKVTPLLIVTLPPVTSRPSAVRLASTVTMLPAIVAEAGVATSGNQPAEPPASVCQFDVEPQMPEATAGL